MSDEDPGVLADQLDENARELKKRSGKLSNRIEDVGEDWRRKRADSSVPGAPPDRGGQSERADAAEDDDAGEHADSGKDDAGEDDAAGEDDRQ